MNYNQTKFKMLLDEFYEFPCEYSFKFIVTQDKVKELITILGKGKIVQKKSSKGNYISVTMTNLYTSSDQIIEIYQKVAIIEGLISL